MCRLNKLFTELIPRRGTPAEVVDQYQRLLASVRPREQVGKTRRRMAAEQVRELVRLDAQMAIDVTREQDGRRVGPFPVG